MKLHREHKIAIGFVTLFAGAYFGYQAYAAFVIDRVEFAALKPSRVNIIGVDTSAGYRIIVANQVAQLVQGGTDDFSAPDPSETDPNQRRRVPLREMLRAMQGDEEALGKFVTGMSEELRKAEMPTVEIVWKAEDIAKALDGDATLTTKLEQDLNMRIDGSPLDQIRMRSVQNGIVIQSRVPITFSVEGQERTLYAEVKLPYRPRFIEDLEKRYQERFQQTPEQVKGYYLELADEQLENPGMKEDIARSLRNRIDQNSLINRFVPDALKVLRNATVLLNDTFMEKASFSEQPGPEGKPVYDLAIDVSEEGRQRLWQFSRKHRGVQLLLVVDGIAIAAPRVRGELTLPQVTIKQVPDRGLVEDAVDLINSLRNNP